MDVTGHLSNKEPESHHLEYKHKRADNSAVTKELVSFANAEGGILILGVKEEEGEIVEIQDIANPSEREEAVQNVIDSQVEPAIRVDCNISEFDEKTVLAFSVEDSDRLHCFEKNGKPAIPQRQGSTTRYLNGYEIEDALGGTTSQSSLKMIEETITERLRIISDRENSIGKFAEGPAVALHLVPHEFDEPRPTDLRSLSEPQPFWAFAGGHTQVKGKEVMTTHRDRRLQDNSWGVLYFNP